MMRVVSAVLAVVSAVLCFACGGTGPGTARKVGELKSDVIEVAADFAADTAEATRVYRGRELEVSGEVAVSLDDCALVK